MKRFTDTDIWRKQWFQDLPPKYKMAWFYLKDNCDNVGIWNVNYKLADFQVGCKINWDDFIEKCNGNIHIVSDTKWWLIDFCNYQYGDLSETSKSPPIVSYIKLLKKHNLWIGYTKGIHTIKEKDKDKEKVQDKEKGKDKDGEKHKYGEYLHVLLTDKQYEDLKDKVDREKWIKIMDESIEEKGNVYKIKNYYLAILKWAKREVDKKPPKISRYIPVEVPTDEENKEVKKLLGELTEKKRFRR